MDMEHIKPATMSTFPAILHKSTHLCCSLQAHFDANLQHTTVIG